MGFWSNLFEEKNHCCSSKKNNEQILDELELSDGDKIKIKSFDPNIIIGKVKKIESHPNPSITKVRITQVDFNEGELVQILCGGINLEENHIVPVARVGAKLSDDFEISVRDIRGVASNGMICARSELNISPTGEQKGEIWVLPDKFETFLGQAMRNL